MPTITDHLTRIGKAAKSEAEHWEAVAEQVKSEVRVSIKITDVVRELRVVARLCGEK